MCSVWGVSSVKLNTAEVVKLITQLNKPFEVQCKHLNISCRGVPRKEWCYMAQVACEQLNEEGLARENYLRVYGR